MLYIIRNQRNKKRRVIIIIIIIKGESTKSQDKHAPTVIPARVYLLVLWDGLEQRQRVVRAVGRAEGHTAANVRHAGAVQARAVTAPRQARVSCGRAATEKRPVEIIPGHTGTRELWIIYVELLAGCVCIYMHVHVLYTHRRASSRSRLLGLVSYICSPRVMRGEGWEGLVNWRV